MNTARSATFGPMSVHIGEAIEARLTEVGMSKSKFADRIGRHRGRIYDVFTAPGCDTVLLRRISQVLECNFFRLLSDDLEPPTAVANEPAAIYGRPAPRPPMRIVIEVEQDNVAAKAEAERMAARIMEKSMHATAPERDKAMRKVRTTTSRKSR